MGTRGGKRPGAGRKVANHTIQIAAARARLVEEYLKEQKEVDGALINKAKEGDVPAIKELYNRIYGKALESIELSGKDGKDIIPTNEEQRTLANAFHEFLRRAER